MGRAQRYWREAAPGRPIALVGDAQRAVLEDWGECSPHFELRLWTLGLEANHFGAHQPAISAALALRCRCVQLGAGPLAIDHDP